MDKILKLAMIGCGGIAVGKHIPSYLKLKNVQIVAICDIIEEKVHKAIKDFSLKDVEIYTDYKEMLKDGKIDAVCVLTPNSSHCQITVDALNAGKHVMCEKPMAISYDEAMQMVSAAEKTGKILTIGYQNRYRQDSFYLKQVCDNGELGDIYFAKARALRRRAVPTWGVFLDEQQQGGGPLIDIGTHALDLTLFMMDNYSPKYAVGTTYHKLNKQTQTANAFGPWNPNEFTVEDSAFGFVVMENGATIIIESSWALNICDTGEAQTLICGTLGGADMFDGLRINGVKNNTQYITKPDFNVGGVDFVSGVAVNDPAGLEASYFVNAIQNNAELYVTPRQAATVTHILEGIYESAKTGKPYYFKK